MVTVMTPKTTGSCGLTPRRRFATSRASTKASTRPMLMPAAGEPRSATENQSQHVAALRAERKAHANLSRMLAHQIGHHAEDAYDRKQQGKHGIDAKHHRRVDQAQ